jgi:hypothetical protein
MHSFSVGVVGNYWTTRSCRLVRNGLLCPQMRESVVRKYARTEQSATHFLPGDLSVNIGGYEYIATDQFQLQSL